MKNPNSKTGLFSLKVKVIATFIVAIIAFFIFNPLAINDAGERTVIQPIRGELWVQFDPGLYFKGFFSKKTIYPNNTTIQVGPEKKRSKDADYWTISNTGTFAEGDQATMGHTVKWDLPNSSGPMIELHKDYTGIDNLATTTLMTYQRETASYSCQRMSSEEHYSGGQSQLKDYFQDQLRNGQVLLITETKTNTLADGSIKTYIEVTEREDKDGVFIRSTNQDIKQYGLRPSFVSIDFIDYDPEIYKKLQTKIKFAADEANSKQELVAAQQQEMTAIVQGRKLIAITTAEQEAAEQTEVIQARKAKLVSIENLAQAKNDAAAVLVAKRAEAEGDRLKVIAGLSPLEKAEIERDTKIGVAKALAGPDGITFPKIVSSGGNSNSSSGALQTLELKMMNDLANDISAK